MDEREDYVRDDSVDALTSSVVALHAVVEGLRTDVRNIPTRSEVALRMKRQASQQAHYRRFAVVTLGVLVFVSTMLHHVHIVSCVRADELSVSQQAICDVLVPVAAHPSGAERAPFERLTLANFVGAGAYTIMALAAYRWVRSSRAPETGRRLEDMTISELIEVTSRYDLPLPPLPLPPMDDVDDEEPPDERT